MTNQDLLVKEFIVIRDGTIRSALETIGYQLIRGGHEYVIDENPLNLPLIPLPYASITSKGISKRR